MEINVLIEKIRKEHNLTMQEMGDKIKTTAGMINHIEKGTKKMSEKMLQKYCTVFPHLKKELMSSYYLNKIKKIDRNFDENKLSFVETTHLNKATELELYNVSAGSGMLIRDEEIKKIQMFLPENLRKNKNIFAVKVNGDSMLPEFKNGDVLVINPNISTCYQELNNKNVIAEVNNERFLKVLKFKDYQPILFSLNELYAPIFLEKHDEVKIIGTVVFMQREM